MPRSKPYTPALGIMDFILFFITGGLWMFIMIPREMVRFNGKK